MRYWPHRKLLCLTQIWPVLQARPQVHLAQSCRNLIKKTGKPNVLYVSLRLHCLLHSKLVMMAKQTKPFLCSINTTIKTVKLRRCCLRLILKMLKFRLALKTRNYKLKLPARDMRYNVRALTSPIKLNVNLQSKKKILVVHLQLENV